MNWFTGSCRVVLVAVSLGSALAKMPAQEAPRVFTLAPGSLAEARRRIEAGDERLRPAVERLRRDAAGALKMRPLSVMQKSRLPPSGDKHDYLSFGPYWWPDPKKPDGLPYIRRDGEVNPESRTGSDSPALGRMASAVDTLALAYYLTGDEKYADHAARLLRNWFLDPETRMNPDLKYGQGVPGRVEGRAEGIIDTTSLIRVVDAVGLVEHSQAWSANDQKGMVAWFDAFLKWLRTSKIVPILEQAAAVFNGPKYGELLGYFAEEETATSRGTLLFLPPRKRPHE